MLIPAYCEEKVIEATVARLAPCLESGRIRLIRKTVNEGKAMALNDALLCLNGEISDVLREVFGIYRGKVTV